MNNKTTKNLIIMFGAVIFSFAVAGNASAAATDCIISNFKANGKTSITVPSGSPVTLSWNTINCKPVKLTGKNVSTYVAQNGYMTINPTSSSDYRISEMLNDYYSRINQTVEVTVIPAAVTSIVSTTPVLLSNQNTYYPTSSTTTTNTNVTNTSTNKNTTAKNTTTEKTNEAGNVLGASAYNSTGNGITALSLRGSGSFMPSSIWQWLLVIVLILIIIIIARSFVKKPSPGDHDTHAAHAH